MRWPLALVTVGLLLSCSSPLPPSPADPAPTPPIATPAVTGAGYALTVNNASDPYPPSGAPPVPPDPGHRYVGLDLTVQHAGEATLPYSLQYWRLADAQGHAYSATPRFGSEQMLEAQDLLPGTRLRGWVVFEVPSGVQGAQVVYQPAGEAARLTAPLP